MTKPSKELTGDQIQKWFEEWARLSMYDRSVWQHIADKANAHAAKECEQLRASVAALSDAVLSKLSNGVYLAGKVLRAAMS